MGWVCSFHSSDDKGSVVVFPRQLPQVSFGVMEELSGGLGGFGP